MKNRFRHTGAPLVLLILLASTSLYGQLPSGVLDATFGAGGKVLTTFGGTGDTASSVAVQPDGKLIASGTTNVRGGTDFALARYLSNGTLDPGFGTGGKVITDVSGSFDGVGSVALQRDGKIVAGGWSVVNSLANFALARYNSNGTLDTSFGSGGKVITWFGGVSAQVFAAALQPDGKIVVAGYANVNGGYDFALARYNSNGALDTTFGAGGKVTTAFGAEQGSSFARAHSLAIQWDGKIVVAGEAFVGAFKFALARYNTNGTLDAGFGTGGKAITSFGFNDRAFSVALQPDGKIVAAGMTNADFALARYNTNGTLDASFGTGGKARTDFAGSSDGASALAIQWDGKIIAAGQTFRNVSFDFAVARYNSNGTLDPSFGTGGKAITNFAGLADQAFSIAIQPDGKAVAAGIANVNGNTRFALARYDQ